MMSPCHDPVTGLALAHLSEGMLVCPDGRRISAMCRAHAEQCIKEYRDKLGEQWSFEPCP